MRATLTRSYLRVLPVGLPLIAAGCDDDLDSGGIIDIIYAAADVVLAILYLVL